MTFFEAVVQGDVRYEDSVCNVKRQIFVDVLASHCFIISIFYGGFRDRIFVKGYELLSELRRLKVLSEQEWSVYKCTMR